MMVINKSDNGVMDSWLCADEPGILFENDVCDTNRGAGGAGGAFLAGGQGDDLGRNISSFLP